MNYQNHSKFPLKKCIIATIIIIICFLLVLTLLYSILYGVNQEDNYIVAIIWAVCLFLAILGYWIYQIIKHHKINKDEKR